MLCTHNACVMQVWGAYTKIIFLLTGTVYGRVSCCGSEAALCCLLQRFLVVVEK